MSAAEMDALLDGLSAEDLDFDPNEEEVKVVSKKITPEPEFDDFGPAFVPFGSSQQAPFIGFVTGRNTVIPPPSHEAFAKARKIFDEDPVLADVTSTLGEPPLKRPRVEASAMMPPPRSSGFAAAGGRAPPDISSSAQAATATLFGKPVPSSSSLPPPFSTPSQPRSGFATAAGRPPPPISPAATSASRELFSRMSESAPARATSGFATATGRAPPPISAAASGHDLFRKDDALSSGFATAGGSAPSPMSGAPAISLFSQPDPHDDFLAGPSTNNYSLGFSTGAGKVVPPPSFAARAKAMAMFDDPDPPVASASSTPLPRPFAPPRSSGLARMAPSQRIGAIYLDDQNSRPTQSAPSFATPRAPTSRQSATGSVFRTPLRATTNTPLQEHLGTGSPAPRKFKPVEIGTPMLRRRVGLGMTPSRFGKGKTGFSSPFKTTPTIEAPPRVSAAPVVVKPLIQPVFDVTKPPDRKTYREAYLKPQYHSREELIEENIPPEIYLMEMRFAKAYRFGGDDHVDLGPSEAFVELQKTCPLATSAWVLNHWCMILWKLAGVIQARYTLYDQLWRWEVVINQLLYRYEREYGRAERPIVRRIHEHDSSPSLPLVLCVSGVIYPPPQVVEEGDKEEPVRPFLELTDGWYRITAQVDDCLAKAVAVGKIRVGRKLSITGAKLESSSDGVDPLESLDKTLLVIAGNSTKLAAWDAKLGRQNEPFVSGLSSLSVDGGVVALMDVVIEKLFPVAYSSAERGNRDAPWGEEEERQRQDAWTERYTAESTRLQGEMRRQLEKIEDVVSALCSAADGVEGGGMSVVDKADVGECPDNVDQIFDSLLEAPSIDSRLRTMAGRTLVHVALYGRSYHEREASNAFMEVEAELQVLCPLRQVRDFRIARVLDARRGFKPACRAGMLTVWDAKALGDALVEGKRYMVANVTPGRAGDWRPPGIRTDGSKADIYLHTRKDTRWQCSE